MTHPARNPKLKAKSRNGRSSDDAVSRFKASMGIPGDVPEPFRENDKGERSSVDIEAEWQKFAVLHALAHLPDADFAALREAFHCGGWSIYGILSSCAPEEVEETILSVKRELLEYRAGVGPLRRIGPIGRRRKAGKR